MHSAAANHGTARRNHAQFCNGRLNRHISFPHQHQLGGLGFAYPISRFFPAIETQNIALTASLLTPFAALRRQNLQFRCPQCLGLSDNGTVLG